MKGLAIVLMALMLVAPLSGCFESYPSSSEADVVITKVDTEVVDGNFRITFHLKNVGKEKANAVLLNKHIENQNGVSRAEGGSTVVSGLNPGVTVTKTETIRIRSMDTKYIANIEVWWMEGSRNYHYEWDIK